MMIQSIPPQLDEDIETTDNRSDVMDIVRRTLDSQGRKYEVREPDLVVFDATTMRSRYRVVVIAGTEAVSCTCTPYKRVSRLARLLLSRATRQERWCLTKSEPKMAFTCGMPAADRFAFTGLMNGADLTPRSLGGLIGVTVQLADALDASLTAGK